jgi:pyruvate formate lyase activating enzyme
MFEVGTTQETGIIFDIQRYSIHDGPGIRTTVFLKGCPLRCPWCANPESQKLMLELEHFDGRCLHCFHCVDICPTAAITKSNGEVRLNRDACNLCGACWEECLGDAIKVAGRRATVGEILSVVERDRLFYERTGGGVTLSGGEPAAQPAFCAALLRACKNRGLHTAIQTTAYQSWELLSPIIAATDLVLLDIKVMNRALHQQIVGAPNDLILANARRIAENAKTAVIIRIPVIPGYNSSIESLQEVLDFASRIGVGEVHLLPYHRLGEPKYQSLGRSHELLGQSVLPNDYCGRILDQLRKHGLVVRIGG